MVIKALIADGWTVTADPLILAYGGRDVYVDVGVEVKSFVGASDVHELEVALGPYNLYRDILSEVEPERLLYLAVPRRVHDGIFTDLLGQLIVHRQQLRLIVFDEVDARITLWIP